MKEAVDVGMRDGNVEACGDNIFDKCHAGNVYDHSLGVLGAAIDVQHESIGAYENYRQVDSKLEEALTTITSLQLQNKTKDNMISLIEEEITKLKSMSNL
ncbi:hypothetical protein CsSME_00050061 [Camellia sinensis var. sinensis]